ncbi:hypothetical protein Q7P37_004965 [Cladosporium fusiforme]
MAPNVSYAKATLPFPIFAAEFDPYNRGYLVVGGGGGEGRSGVPNQIAVLDVSDRSSITTAAEIDLSRDEDSVQSLSSLATSDGLITFAGINSSQANQNAGKNDHFRSFEVKYPPRKKQRTEEEKGHIGPLGRNSLFKPSPSAKSETYQRLLRLSPAQKRANGGGKRIGAIATGLAKRSELVIFNATTSTPGSDDVITRIEPDNGAEVGDLDLATSGTNDFSVAYCTDYDLYEQTYQYDFSTKQVQKTPRGPRRFHQMPYPDAGEDPSSRLKFRALRFIDPQNVIALLNRPGRKGSELRIYHLYPTGPAAVILQMKLPSHIKQAVSLDVCTLDMDKKGNRQTIVAVAGQDISIEVYTINYSRNTDTFSRFRSFQRFKDVHPQQMTKLCLSPFHSPARAQESDSKSDDEKKAAVPMHPGPQYVRLASVSYGNTVVVDTFPLSPFDPKDKDSRYVLSHPSDERFQRLAYTYFAFAIPLLLAYLVHVFMYPETTIATRIINVLPEPARHYFGTPLAAPVAQNFGDAVHSTASSIVASNVPTAVPGQQTLQDLVSVPGGEKNALVVRHDPADSGVAVDVHPDKKALLAEHAEAKHWDDLSDHHKAEWKRKLIAAGYWAEHEGEKVLKGVMFSTYAGLVGQAAGEILREL